MVETILIDLDNVLWDFAGTLLKYCNQEYNTNYTKEDIDHYNWFNEKFADPWAITNYKEFWDSVAETTDLELVKYCEELISKGKRIYITSASHYNKKLYYKIRKILSYFNPKYLTEYNIIITQNKAIVNGDLLIDDCISNLVAFPRLTICWDQNWNKEFETPFRASNWRELDKILKKM